MRSRLNVRGMTTTALAKLHDRNYQTTPDSVAVWDELCRRDWVHCTHQLHYLQHFTRLGVLR
jgi:hypothetical protein